MVKTHECPVILTNLAAGNYSLTAGKHTEKIVISANQTQQKINIPVSGKNVEVIIKNEMK
ncbi:hypothetical protein FACS189413_17760 [Bacteroidia bacterium]|nr:hypothetical protein FACS189413_17760 [Bacteroidia bacterium]